MLHFKFAMKKNLVFANSNCLFEVNKLKFRFLVKNVFLQRKIKEVLLKGTSVCLGSKIAIQEKRKEIQK